MGERTLEDWLGALSGGDRVEFASAVLVPEGEAEELLGDLREWIRWRVPEWAPYTREGVSYWLGRLETLDLAIRGLRALGDQVPWGARLIHQAEQCLTAARPAVEALPPWWYARTARSQRGELGEDVRPWAWVPALGDRGGVGAVREEDRAEVIVAWAEGALLDEEAEALRDAVTRPGSWQDRYRGWLQDVLGVVVVERREAGWELPSHRVLRKVLPHLGDGGVLRVRWTDGGTLWELGGWRAAVPYGTREVHLPLGDALGVLRIRVEEQELDEQQQAARVMAVARTFLDELESHDAVGMALLLALWLQREVGRVLRAKSAPEAYTAGLLAMYDNLMDARAVLEEAGFSKAFTAFEAVMHTLRSVDTMLAKVPVEGEGQEA